MGFPPDDFELASIIEAEIGLVPVTNEHTDAVIEASMGRYVVRGDVEGELPITNEQVGGCLARNLAQAMADEGGAAFFAYGTSTATIRALTENLIVTRPITSGVHPYSGSVDAVDAGALRDSALMLPPTGQRADDVAVVDERGDVVAIVESKASMRGFDYPLRASAKAATQLARTLRVNPGLPGATLVLIDLCGHNILVRWRDRDWWLKTDGRGLRRELRTAARNLTWPGDPPWSTSP